jgi:hypothetical protein
MSSEKPRPTLADYVAIAISPALIVVLVTSLVFFLLEILYAGDYPGRLQWILFFFVVGAVLIARISMETAIAGRAPLYGLVLGVLVWIGMGQFVDYPAGLVVLSWLINAVLIAIVWWSAHRLTWDCTHIDEKAEATGTGVLQAAGLDDSLPPSEPAEGATPGEDEPRSGKKAGKPGWWDRFQRYREERKKKHTPGVWVVYFSLAALPLFGLGQSLLDPEDVAARRYTFWLMGLYVASGLGLLATTAFLGLRRYLRQRRLEMPKPITTAWLAGAGALIVVLLVAGALLPRPEAEYSLLDLTPIGSKERDASDYALKGGDPGQGEGRAGAQQIDKQEGQPVNTNNPDSKGSGGKGKAQGQGSGEQGDQKGGSGDRKGEGNDQQSKSGDRPKAEGQANGRPREPRPKGRDNQQAGNAGGDTETQDSRAESRARKRGRTGSSYRGRSSFSSVPWLGNVAAIAKWVVFAILAVLAVLFVLRGGLRYLANFLDWPKRLLDALRNFWALLFGRRQAVSSAGGAGEAAEPERPRRPFHWYRNPFHDGRAEQMPAAELIRYSFEALEAWAGEHDRGRGAEETPLEFAERVGDEAPGLAAEAKRLAALYARVLYAKGVLPGNWRAIAEKFWERLEAVAEQPLSA